MRVGSLFSGIGGLDLGLERAGMEVAWQCEIDPYCRKVLAKHWPNVPCYEDVRELPDDIERVDLICGGYPCQPFSTAGHMRGAADARHLWPDFAALIRRLRPDFALLENVPAHVGLGLDRVLGDLAELGFDAEWSIVPAAAVGATQRRPRLFVLAYAQEPKRFRWGGLPAIPPGAGDHRAVADVHGCRSHLGGPTNAEPWTGESGIRRMGDGVPGSMDRARLFALGNAVVPQVAELIGRRIMEAAMTAPTHPTTRPLGDLHREGDG